MNAEETRKLYDYDKNRLAYMVAWRDRHIAALKERLEGQEEQELMMQTLLFYALHAAGEQNGKGEREVAIPKAEIAALLGHWQCSTTDGGDHYLVRFFVTEKEGENGAAGAQE